MFHWQNLNDKQRSKDGTVKGLVLKHGRAWWHFGERVVFGWEWNFLSKRFSVSLGLGDHESAISLNLSLILFSFYAHLDYWPLEHWLQDKTKRADQKYGEGREIGFHWTTDTLFINIWRDPMEWRASDPWWQHISICPADLILGRRKHSLETLRTAKASVPMPERSYPALVTIQRRTWKRARWPFPLVRLEANIEVPGGVPVPGKGENAWDCGEDAIMSTGSSTPTVASAVAQMVKSALETRERYGGQNWRPSRV